MVHDVVNDRFGHSHGESAGVIRRDRMGHHFGAAHARRGADHRQDGLRLVLHVFLIPLRFVNEAILQRSPKDAGGARQLHAPVDVGGSGWLDAPGRWHAIDSQVHA